MKLLRSQADMLDAYRGRIRELGIAHTTVDAISGLPDGYTGKLMCGMKNPGPKAHELLCGALGIAFVVQVDQEAAARVESRWVKRKRALNKSSASISASINNEVPIKLPITPALERLLASPDWMRSIASLGGRGRAQKLSPRQRKLIAKRAARARWARAIA